MFLSDLKTANDLLREAQQYYMLSAAKCPYEVGLRKRISAHLDKVEGTSNASVQNDNRAE